MSGEPVNHAAIAALCRALPIPIEVGGGVRTVERAAELLAMGVDRVIFGTAALADPETVRTACRRFPGRIAVGIDARDGKVAVHGLDRDQRHDGASSWPARWSVPAPAG